MANILILGEHDKGHSEAFSPKTVSGRRLRRILAAVAVEADLGNVFNYVNGEPTKRDLSSVCNPYHVVVAVGRVASEECVRQDIKHIHLPHPAVRNASKLRDLEAGLGQLQGKGTSL